MQLLNETHCLYLNTGVNWLTPCQTFFRHWRCPLMAGPKRLSLITVDHRPTARLIITIILTRTDYNLWAQGATQNWSAKLRSSDLALLGIVLAWPSSSFQNLIFLLFCFFLVTIFIMNNTICQYRDECRKPRSAIVPTNFTQAGVVYLSLIHI